MLRQRALSATIWSGLDIFLRQGLQFGITLALARLLSPADFGTVALLALFTGLATVIADGGFSAALIQRQDINHADESTVFWFNLGVGGALSLLLWLVAPFIARFFSRPILIPLTALLALSILLGSLGSIHSTLLTKGLDFLTQLKVGLTAAILAGGLAVWMAWHGFGVWALVAQALVMSGVTTTMLWVLHGWRPAWVFSRESVRKLFGFGGYHLGSSLLEIFYARLYSLLLGKFYGVRDLGLYNNADTTRQLPSAFLASMLSRVAFPMFSEAAHDKGKLRRGMQFAVRVAMLVNVPVMFGMFVVADSFLRVLFGAQWVAATPILRILCFAGVLWPLQVFNLNVLLAQGHSNLMFRLELVKKSIGIILLCIGAIHGVKGIAWSQVVYSILAFMLNAHYTKMFLGYGCLAQARDSAPMVIAACAMSVIVYYVSTRWAASPPLKLVGLSSLGFVVYLLMVWVARMKAFGELTTLFRRRQAGSDL